MANKFNLMLILQCIFSILQYIHINFVSVCDSIHLHPSKSFLHNKHRNPIKIINFISNNTFYNNLIPKNNWLISNRHVDTIEDYTKYEEILQSSSIKALDLPEKYYVLAIETSCDDTAVSILDNTGNIISEYNKNQTELVEKYKGIHPLEAKNHHEKFIQLGIEQVLTDSKISPQDIGFIAVTRGPGLELCLRVGYNAAIQFGKLHNIPVVGSNHIASHISTPIYDSTNIQSHDNTDENLDYPFLALLLSGGHSQIYIVTSPITFFLLCDSIDSYMGSSLDKAARQVIID